MSVPVICVSLVRAAPARFETFRELMSRSRAAFASGLQSMPGARSYLAGADPVTGSLINVSLWDTLEDARRMESFRPMHDLALQFAELGAWFERPVMRHATLWRFDTAHGRESS